MTRLLLAASLVIAACDGEPECIVIPGAPVESGSYTLHSMSTHPVSADWSHLPYGNAEGVTIEINADRSQAVLRFEADGVSVEETFAIRVVP